MKTTCDDLKAAILAVLKDAQPDDLSDQSDPDCVVHTRLLNNLQAEYNIYFVEPNQPQVELV